MFTVSDKVKEICLINSERITKEINPQSFPESLIISAYKAIL